MYAPGALGGTEKLVSSIHPRRTSIKLTSFIRVRLHIPVSVDILWLVGLDTSSLNLLETPLWQVDIASAEVAVEIDMSEAE